MNTFLTYGAFGLMVLVVLLVAHFLKKRNGKDSIATGYPDASRGRQSLVHKIAENVLVPVLAGVLVIVAWPVVVVWGTRQLVSASRRKSLADVEQFAVKKEQLLEMLSKDDIEQRERVEDPLSAVPDLPFGHLNAAWTNYVDSLPADSELWSFRAHWRNSWGPEQIITGYASFMNDEVGLEFVTMRKNLEELE